MGSKVPHYPPLGTGFGTNRFGTNLGKTDVLRPANYPLSNVGSKPSGSETRGNSKYVIAQKIQIARRPGHVLLPGTISCRFFY